MYSISTLRRECLHFVAILSFLSATTGTAQVVTTYSFTYTGAMQSFVVPSCVTQLTVHVFGAQGGNAAYAGGLGGGVSGVFTVTTGQTVRIMVGGQGSGTSGGLNGGGNGGGLPATNFGAGGGGASDIRI